MAASVVRMMNMVPDLLTLLRGIIAGVIAVLGFSGPQVLEG